MTQIDLVVPPECRNASLGAPFKILFVSLVLSISVAPAWALDMSANATASASSPPTRSLVTG